MCSFCIRIQAFVGLVILSLDASSPTTILKNSPVLHFLDLKDPQKAMVLGEHQIPREPTFACPMFVFFGVSQRAGPVTLNVVLSEVVPELRWKRQGVYALVGGAATDHSPAQVLQGEREGPR